MNEAVRALLDAVKREADASADEWTRSRLRAALAEYEEYKLQYIKAVRDSGETYDD